MFCLERYFPDCRTAHILLFDQVCGQFTDLGGFHGFPAGVTGSFHIGDLHLVGFLGHPADPGTRERHFHHVSVEIHLSAILGLQTDIKCDHIADPGFLCGRINLVLCCLDQGFPVAHLFYQKHGVCRKNAFLCTYGNIDPACSLLVGKCRMLGHFLQGYQDLQVFGSFFHCIDKLISGQLSCPGFCCIHSLKLCAVGCHGADFEAHLGIHRKIQVFTFIDGFASFDLGCPQRIHTVVHPEHACHCIDSCQILCCHLVGSCICRIPDGHSIVGSSIQCTQMLQCPVDVILKLLTIA